MTELIFVTNRKICKDHFLRRIDQLAMGKPQAILLREKDLSLAKYESLAARVKNICDRHGVTLIISQNIESAVRLGLNHIHLSMPALRRYHHNLTSFVIGTSVHSVSEAKEAQELGVNYLIAGHVFPTECKKGVPPRGLEFLKNVCETVDLPVYAIGGITKDKIVDVVQTGAHGICVMSEAMTCEVPSGLGKLLRMNSLNV